MGDKPIAESLGRIISLLADVWPTDRENVALAGAEFEDFASGFTGSRGLQGVIDGVWKGLMHLFQEDDYFLSVKAAVMGAVNLIREYHLRDGEISVEEVEAAVAALEKALSGEGESADRVIELDEVERLREGSGTSTALGSSDAGDVVTGSDDEEVTLDRLAACLMELDEHSVSAEELRFLAGMVEKLIAGSPHLAEVLREAEGAIEQALAAGVDSGGDSSADWLSRLSELTEKAMQLEADRQWEEGASGSAASGSAASEPVASGQAATDEPEQGAEAGRGSSGRGSSGQGASDQEEAGDDIPRDFAYPDDTDPEMIEEFISECQDLIESAENALLELEESPDDEELVNTVFRAFHTIKGTSAFMGLDPVSEFTHSAETMLSMVRDKELPFDSACADLSFRSIDVLKELLSSIESTGGEGTLQLSVQYGTILGMLHRVSRDGILPAEALASGAPAAAVGASPSVPPSSDPAQADAAPSGSNAPSTAPEAVSGKENRKTESDATVRVSVNRLDRLVDLVGELVIAHSVVAQDSLFSKDIELQKKVSHASKILRELQDTSLTLRMVPLKSTFQKMTRLVRDLSRKAGKQITFSTIGEETEMDRNMVDVINEPLVHMLRNALDHGIEEPEERSRTGKPETATIWFRAFQEGGKVVIEIEDDGRGIDKEKIFAKAVEKGLVDPGARLSEREIFNLIFAPGFSSAEKVTDLSGRGVGMDVVRRSIEQLNGKIDVWSVLGKGTRISLELPFTLAITDGMLVRVSDQRFIIPIMNIEMAFRASGEDLFTVMHRSEQVLFQGRTIPVIRLHQLFRLQGAVEDLLEGTLLVVRSSNKRYALFVDEVIGQRQLVGKSIKLNVKMDHISGGAILEDGRVGLILDTAAIVN